LPCCVDGYSVAVTTKLLELAAVPPPVVMDTDPLLAPGITMATMVLPSLEMIMAGMPPIYTADGLSKLFPEILTKVPTAPAAGVKELIAGTGGTVNTQAAP